MSHDNETHEVERDLVVKILVALSIFFLLVAAAILELALQAPHLPSP